MSNIENLRKYSTLECGKVICSFMLQLETIKSNIGEYKRSLDGLKYRYVVSGLTVHSDESPVDILSSIDLGIDAAEKFKVYGKTPLALMTDYIDTCGESGLRFKQKLVNKYTNIVKNKEMIQPFKIGSSCILMKDKKQVNADITGLKWCHKNSKLGAYVLVKEKVEKVEKSATKPVTQEIPFEEYTKTFKLQDMNLSLKQSELNSKIIQMTQFGFVKPIEVVDDEIAIVIDGCNCYITKHGDIYIAGKWNNGTIEIDSSVVDEVSKTKAYEYIKKYEKLIAKHTKYIAPYKITDTNIIRL